ncbi:hypothetical protein BPT24_030 [Tenacibaculum phage pT24]|uniref:Uncharacterized protein n=1 Tax=Tenacibaculum phage pT24 TaxID=1880590 RepID=A0A1W7GKP5_9CAUD|nr:hypothetical protein HYP10_gp030 [Tenacibaculum phage pT24]BAX25547.1 hypothetical protein BPT24_030 [Tenacibaculum phage pT24]
MDLLGKFSNVKVDNTNRLPHEDISYLDALLNDYKEALQYNKECIKSLEQLRNIKPELKQRVINGTSFNNTFEYMSFDSKESLLVAQKDAGNCHHRFIKSVSEYICKKYNIEIDIEKWEFSDGYAVKQLYNHSRYPTYWGMSDKVKYSAISDLELHYDTIIDYIFEQIGGLDLNEHQILESKKFLYELYNEDTHRGDVIIAKNGSLSFPSILNNPKSHHARDYNLKLIKSLSTVINELYKEYDSSVSDVLTYKGFIKEFCINHNYSLDDEKCIYDKKMTGTDIIEYYQLSKNGKIKIKFKSHTLANEFLTKIN